MRHILLSTLLLLFGLFAIANQTFAQTWSYTEITSTGDTILNTFPPPSSSYVHNVLVLKFYDGGISKDSLCYDCGGIVHSENKSKGSEPLDDDPYGIFALCKQTLMAQKFTLGIINDPGVRSLLSSRGVSYLMRMTAANPCADTLSVTRSGDTISMDPYNWIVAYFDNDTSVVNTLVGLALLKPTSLQLATPSFWMKPDTHTPNDHEYAVDRQKSLGLIGLARAWDFSVGVPAVKVAVIDDGVDYLRCELGGGIGPGYKVVGGWDYYTGTMEACKDGGTPHGTNCASIIGAYTNDSRCGVDHSVGMAGIAGGFAGTPDEGPGVSIVAYRIVDNTGYRSDWAASAILEVSQKSTNSHYGFGVSVINNSWGHTSLLPELRSALAESYKNSVSVVASMGNENNPGRHFPATIDPPNKIIAVGAAVPYQNKIRRQVVSNFNRYVDLLAPGGACGADYTAAPTDEQISVAWSYGIDAPMWFCNTSAAAPHVSGVVALLRSSNLFPQGTYPEDWEGILESFAVDLVDDPDAPDPNWPNKIYAAGYDQYTGWGMLQAGAIFDKIDPNGADAYRLFHYSVPGALCTKGDWSPKGPVNFVDYGKVGSGLRAGQYVGRWREIIGSADYSSSINRNKPVYAWGGWRTKRHLRRLVTSFTEPTRALV